MRARAQLLEQERPGMVVRDPQCRGPRRGQLPQLLRCRLDAQGAPDCVACGTNQSIRKRQTPPQALAFTHSTRFPVRTLAVGRQAAATFSTLREARGAGCASLAAVATLLPEECVSSAPRRCASLPAWDAPRCLPHPHPSGSHGQGSVGQCEGVRSGCADGACSSCGTANAPSKHERVVALSASGVPGSRACW